MSKDSAENMMNFISFVESKMAEFHCSAHNSSHVHRVANIAKHLAESEPNCNVLVACIAGLSHDLLDSKLLPTANYDSSESQLRFELAKLLGSTECELVVHIAKSVGYKNLLRTDWNPLTESREYRCVQDADLLDAIGTIGIGRCYSFGGSRNRNLFELSDEIRQDTISHEEYSGQLQKQEANGGGSCIEHFFEKLLRLKGLMTTSKGKALAEIRQQSMLTYLESLSDELCLCGSLDGDRLKQHLLHFRNNATH